jgi:glyoxylate reductase
MARVLITRKLPEDAEEILRAAGIEVTVGAEERNLTKGELIAAVKRGYDGVIQMLSDRIDAQVIDAASPPCRIFANYAVGYNNVDLDAAAKKNVFVTNTPGVLTDTTADLAWALIMACARRTVEADKYLRKEASTGMPGWNGWQGWESIQFLGVDVNGKTLGIIGAGRIGTEVARRGTGFKMKILYYSHDVNPEMEGEMHATRTDLETLLKESDFVSLHVPLTAETTHMIGARELGMMKPTAVLVNTARGPVVDEKALVDALRMGRIRAAGLDVYENEPRLQTGLVGLENAVILPHIGSATGETRGRMARMAAENVIAVLKGQTPPNLVTIQAGK